jgi:hypothetical protein
MIAITPTRSTGVIRRRRSLRRRFWAPVAFLLIATWFIRFAHLRITVRPTPRPDYWALRIAAIDPPGEGALPAKEACAILAERPWETDTYLMRSVSGYGPDITRNEWDSARSDIAAADAIFRSSEYEKAFERVREAAIAGWQDDPSPRPDWPTDLSRHCQTWAGYLASHSRWVIETSGNLDRAADDWLTLIRIGRQVRRSQTSLRYPGESSFQQRAVREMMATALEHPARFDVRSLATQIHAIIGPSLHKEMLERDRLYMHSILEHRYVREGGDWLDVEAAVVAARFDDPYPSSGPVSRWWNIGSPLFHDLGRAQEDVERLVDSLRAASFGRVVVLFDSDSTAIQKSFLQGHWQPWERYVMLALIHDSITRSELEAALTMLALADHHAALGAYPDRLEQLVPERLPRIPIEIFAEQPISYRRTDSGYVLYSVGRDRLDGGGTADSYHPDDVNTRESDIVFSLYRRSS